MAISPKLLNQGERVIVDTRTHVKVLFLPALILIATLFVAAFASTQWSGTVDLVVWVIGALLLVWFVVRPFLNWWTTTYTFTDRRFLTRSGLIAKKGSTIPLNRISEVDFSIGVIDRLFGCGTLIVSDASEAGRNSLHDIPHVEKVQMAVVEQLHAIAEGRNQSADEGS